MDAPSNKKFVIYCRVSTREQGISGLGLNEQIDVCRKYIESKSGEIIGTYQDVKSGSSKKRHGLLRALSVAKDNNATIVFAKLDRMSRESEYAHSIRNSGVPLYFCDFPEINSLLFGILVAVAQYEKELGQDRTKAALNSIRREIARDGSHLSRKGNIVTGFGRKRGAVGTPISDISNAAWKEKIGGDETRFRQWKLINEMRSRGDTMNRIAETMNAVGELTPNGGKWTCGQIYRALNDWKKYFVNTEK